MATINHNYSWRKDSHSPIHADQQEREVGQRHSASSSPVQHPNPSLLDHNLSPGCQRCARKYGHQVVPKLLACHHTFCEICLKNAINNNRIQCFKCQAITELGPQGVDGLVRNFALDVDKASLGAMDGETYADVAEAMGAMCAVCVDHYGRVNRVPKLLHCGHTFCEICLGRIQELGTCLCPLCYKSTTLPRGGVKALETNEAIVVLAEDLRARFLGRRSEDPTPKENRFPGSQNVRPTGFRNTTPVSRAYATGMARSKSPKTAGGVPVKMSGFQPNHNSITEINDPKRRSSINGFPEYSQGMGRGKSMANTRSTSLGVGVGQARYNATPQPNPTGSPPHPRTLNARKTSEPSIAPRPQSHPNNSHTPPATPARPLNSTRKFSEPCVKPPMAYAHGNSEPCIPPPSNVRAQNFPTHSEPSPSSATPPRVPLARRPSQPSYTDSSSQSQAQSWTRSAMAARPQPKMRTMPPTAQANSAGNPRATANYQSQHIQPQSYRPANATPFPNPSNNSSFPTYSGYSAQPSRGQPSYGSYSRPATSGNSSRSQSRSR